MSQLSQEKAYFTKMTLPNRYEKARKQYGGFWGGGGTIEL